MNPQYLSEGGRSRSATPFRPFVCATVLAAAVAGAPNAAAPVAAQEPAGPPASQHGTVSQTVNRTIISAGYDRPVARGRVLFGDSGLVANDALWTPGANRATWVEFSTNVEINGNAVPAGRYSLWSIPRNGPWSLLLNKTWDTHHAIYPGDVDDVLRIEVSPERGEHMEALALYFPVVGPYETELRIHWGTVVVPLRITVPE